MIDSHSTRAQQFSLHSSHRTPNMICSKLTLLGVIVLQWLMLTTVLYHRQVGHISPEGSFLSSPASISQQVNVQQQTHQHQNQQKIDYQQEWKGVAATLALRAPKWFHRRYTTMIYNVIDNTPESWAVQIFVHPGWWQKEILKFHRGMHKLLQHPRIVVTELPKQFWTHKPKQILIQKWFWEQMVADQILLFSGNGVMCSHSAVLIDAFHGMDFCGAPSRGNSLGGDGGTHSIRNRNAMLDAITYGKPGMDLGSESGFFISTLQKMNTETPGKYRLASKNETILFGGGAQLITEHNEIKADFEQYGPSLVMSGTGMHLAWDVRESLLQICPEWKLIFPSLHEPNCFGAKPVADKCAASICALKPNRPKQGC